MMLRIAPEALADIDGIASYLSNESRSASDGFERRIAELFEIIKGNRHIGRATNRRPVRFVNTRPYPYLMFYRVEPSEVRVLRIMHGARNPKSMPARPR